MKILQLIARLLLSIPPFNKRAKIIPDLIISPQEIDDYLLKTN
jgi:hypothetical protein